MKVKIMCYDQVADEFVLKRDEEVVWDQLMKGYQNLPPYDQFDKETQGQVLMEAAVRYLAPEDFEIISANPVANPVANPA